MAAKSDAKPKPTAEERLQLRRARLAEEQAKIEAADKALTEKAIARKQQEDFLKQARIDAELYLSEWMKSANLEKSDRERMGAANANVRRLEYALGLRKRGAAAEVGQPPAAATEAAPDAPVGGGGASTDGGETDAD
jgi:hypothetical protein